MAIADKLTQLNNVKLAIKQALINKEVDMTGVPFTEYASKIDELSDVIDIYKYGTENASYPLTLSNATKKSNNISIDGNSGYVKFNVTNLRGYTLCYELQDNTCNYYWEVRTSSDKRTNAGIVNGASNYGKNIIGLAIGSNDAYAKLVGNYMGRSLTLYRIFAVKLN